MRPQRSTSPQQNAEAVKLNPAQTHRFHSLDALRGILAILVVLRHSPEDLTAQVQTKNIFLAVDFFFCLSGFVIAYAYDDRLRTRLKLQDFVVARLIRFYPTFLVGTLLAFLFAIGPDHMLNQPNGKLIVAGALPSLIFLPSLPTAANLLLFPLNMSSWTLFLELVINLGYALLVKSRRAVYPALMLICVASWFELAFAHPALDSGSTWPGVLVGCARMGFSFAAGAFLLNFWRRLPAQGFLRRTRGLPTALTITVVLLAVILVPAPFSGERAYQLAIITLVLPSLIFFGADIQLGPKASSLCAALGELSYPLYIIHLPMLSPLFGSHVRHLAAHSRTLAHLLVPAYILSLAALAWALRIYFDAPLGRWLTRQYNQRRRSRNTLAPVAPQTQQPQLAQS